MNWEGKPRQPLSTPTSVYPNPVPLAAPHLRVFINVEPETAFQRVQAKTQPNDAEISLSHLQHMHRLHLHWFQEQSDPHTAFPGKEATKVRMIDGEKPPHEVANDLQLLINFLTGRNVRHSLAPAIRIGEQTDAALYEL